MNTCPMHNKLRAELPPTTPRIATLPVDARGYPVPFFVAWVNGVPFFVAWVNGVPDFRLVDPEKWRSCLKYAVCWVCGQPLGSFKAFVLGPMCSITRTSAEPPSHLDCAMWSAQACPFLTRPHMVRREDELTEANATNVAGIMLKRNPGASAVWSTRSFSLFGDQNGKPLFEVGAPDSVSWWREGRAATRQEVVESINSGLPKLVELCQTPDDFAELKKRVSKAQEYLPKL